MIHPSCATTASSTATTKDIVIGSLQAKEGAAIAGILKFGIKRASVPNIPKNSKRPMYSKKLKAHF